MTKASAPVAGRWLLWLVCLFAVLGGWRAAHALRIANTATICQPPLASSVQCMYRWPAPGALPTITASANGKPVPVTALDAPIGASHAVLILVDTSQPIRDGATGKMKGLLLKVLDAHAEHHRVGIYTISNAFAALAPLASGKSALRSAVGEIKFADIPTELFRGASEAVAVLADETTTFKTLLIVSDGIAEDVAYFQDDVIAAARESGIAIWTVGFPRTPKLAAHLQTLRRMSEETGGNFVAADDNDLVPEAFLNAPFARIDKGGQIVLNLDATLADAARAEFVFRGDAVDSRASVRIQTGSSMGPAPARPGHTPPAAKLQGLQPPPDDRFIFTLAAVVAGVAILAILGTGWWRTKRVDRERIPEPAGNLPETEEPGAGLDKIPVLESEDDRSARHILSTTVTRIGRHSDNDILLNDASISRHHAEISQRHGGRFVVTDLESMNGVYVNDRAVHSSRLKDGDLLELGDVSLRFRLLDEITDDGDTEGTNTLVLDPNRLDEDEDGTVLRGNFG